MGRMAATLFLLLLFVATAAVPILAALLRRGLPASRRAGVALEEVAFGNSGRARRSPRHAILLHRALVSSFFVALAALLLLPAALATREVGVALLRTGLFFVLPLLVVTLHGRGRVRS